MSRRDPLGRTSGTHSRLHLGDISHELDGGEEGGSRGAAVLEVEAPLGLAAREVLARGARHQHVAAGDQDLMQFDMTYGAVPIDSDVMALNCDQLTSPPKAVVAYLSALASCTMSGKSAACGQLFARYAWAGARARDLGAISAMHLGSESRRRLSAG